MRQLRIMVVCGFGLGSSMILKMTLDEVLREQSTETRDFLFRRRDSQRAGF